MEFIQNIDINNRLVFKFTRVDDNIWCTWFQSQTREAGKRKWNAVKTWDLYFSRNSNTLEPNVPSEIMDEVLKYYQNKLKIIKFSDRFSK